jgi:peroxiredoxin family protein
LPIVNDDERYELAAILASGDVGALYSGLSVLVSAAADGKRCAALASFGALDLLLDPDLPARADGSEAFGRALGELRDAALEFDNLTIWACSASVQTMGIEGEPLAGVMSTPRFLRATDGARLIHV